MAFVDLTGPAGRLEALYWKVSPARAAAAVCHPHPLHGGTMHNHVTYRIAAAFRDAGVSTVRFNFRGVGRSEGAHDQGVGEVDDAKAALDFLERDNPGVPLLASGFSFGSRAALRLALRDARVSKVLAVGLAVGIMDFEFVAELQKPLAVIHSDRDEFGSLEKVRALLARVRGPSRLFVLADADHLCTGRLDAFEEVAREAVGWLLDADA
jgi:alpha/beta superfamily hydrolase